MQLLSFSSQVFKEMNDVMMQDIVARVLRLQLPHVINACMHVVICLISSSSLATEALCHECEVNFFDMLNLEI